MSVVEVPNIAGIAVSGSPPFDPTTSSVVFDDFIIGEFNPGNNQIYSDHSWLGTFQNVGSMTLEGTAIPSDSSHPGIVEIHGGANAISGAALSAGAFGGSADFSYVIGNGTIVYEALINVNSISNGTNNLQINVGFRDGPGWNASSNGWHIQYQFESSNNWQLITTKAATSTTVTSSVAATTGWHHFRLTTNATGTSVEGFVDGVSLGTSSTNIPTTGVPPLISARKTLGSADQYIGLDYVRITKTLTTPR